jgi:tetratricopeptide (TPR) repeat protein
MSARRTTRIVVALVALITFALAPVRPARADENGREAGKHFQRGVALYGEADYRAALVEFKRAYALSPNAAVLYNVGETEFQLQDYAGALTSFERYLSESSPLEVHRGEVETNVETLKARVGHVTIATTPVGADVTIDDQAVGHTPLERSVLVSVGHRRIVASMAGHQPVTRYIDVATDDNVMVSLQLPAQSESSPQVASSALSPASSDLPHSSRTGATLRTVGWIATAALATGAATFGIVALKDSSDLRAARNTFPTSQDTLSHDASLTSRYSVLADSLTAAALVVGGITLVSTLTSNGASSRERGSTGAGTRVVLGPATARLEVTF